MNTTSLDQIIEAVLYEGYILYPYRASSKKNRRERFTFGRVYPQSCSLAQEGLESFLTQTECLARVGDGIAQINISLRFLQPVSREIGTVDPSAVYPAEAELAYRIVPELRVGQEIHQTWLEAVERRINAPGLDLERGRERQHSIPFQFPGARSLERISEGNRVIGVIVRQQEQLDGRLEITANPIEPGLFKITVRALNTTLVPDPEATSSESLLKRTFASTHIVLSAEGAEFVSLMDPEPAFRSAADLCKNIGTWPVLVGEESRADRQTVLASPIILYDYPKVAPESAGSLFDGTEIDEILTLRILTMTDEEKSEMRRVDEQARLLLERTEALPPESLLQMHGTMRSTDSKWFAPFDERETGSGCAGHSVVEADFEKIFGAPTPIEQVSIRGVCVRRGARVRIQPKARADVLDLALNGRTAVVEAIEQDAEQRIHLAVVVEDDPGMDLGILRQPGHRFFYGLDEVEPLQPAEL